MTFRLLAKSLDRALGALIDGLGALAGAAIAFITVSISAEVMVRAAGGRPFGWTLEMAEYGLLVIGFLGAPWVLRHGDHIRVDIGLRSVPSSWTGSMLIAANLIACATCLVLALFGAMAAWEAFVSGATLFKQVPLPQWIPLAFLPVSVFLLAYEFLARVVRRLAGAPVDGEGLGGPAL